MTVKPSTTNGVYIERRQLRGTDTLSKDIAGHLYTRLYEGKAIVLTDQRAEMMGAVVKRWRQLELQVKREKSKTLDAVRRDELDRELARMQAKQFSAKPGHYAADTVVSFAPGRDAFELPVACKTLYVACPVNNSALELLSRWVHDHGLIVVYEHTFPS